MFQIRILNAKDGTPHHLPPNNIISWDTELNNEDVYIPCARMTASRLMIFASTYMTNVLIVWDWKAGGVVRVIIFGRLRLSFLSPLQVLKRSSVEDAFLCYRYLEFDFLDEFRLLTFAAPSKDDLIVFDTSVPQRSPDSWRQLNIDLPYRYLSDRSPSYAWKLSIHTDTDRSRGEGSCDGPFIIDPTRSIVVIARTRHGDFPIGETVLVISAASLFRRMSSTRSSMPIPWNEWKRDVMVVEISRYISHVRTFVHGTRVLLMTYSPMERYCVRAYDFSRWGCRGLVRVGNGEKEKMVMPRPEKVWFLSELGNGLQNMRALGDSIVTCAVGDSRNILKGAVYLRLV